MKSQDINKRGKLEHMTAPDLFQGPSTLQVFSAKSGKWIGTVKKGEAPPVISEEYIRERLTWLYNEKQETATRIDMMLKAGIKTEDLHFENSQLILLIKVIEEYEAMLPQQSEQQATDPTQMKLF